MYFSLNSKLKYLLTTIIFFSVLLVPFSHLKAQNMTAEDIINKAEKKMDYGSYKAEAEMSIITNSGEKRILKMKLWGKNTDKMMMKYFAPSRIDGVTFLFKDNNIWTYFPRTGRVRHLASSAQNQKMMGSSFSYTDFSTSTFDNYQVELTGKKKIKGDKYYILEGLKKNEDASYDKCLVQVTLADFKVRKIEYYNKKQKVKVMEVSSYQEKQGLSRPMKIIMQDLQGNTKTTFKYNELETGVEFPAAFFKKRNIKRISNK